MLRSTLAALALSLSVGFAQMPAHAQAPALDPNNTIVLETKDGKVTIRLRPDLAPKHVAQIKTLTKRGFYDGIVFHRVIDGFMAQTGDGQYGNGTGGSKYPNLKAEFSNTPFVRGTVGMARASSPDSANSQFFICYADSSFLNGQYTVVGQVVSGMEFIDKLKKGPKEANGAVPNPDRIVKMQVAADVK